MDSSNNKDKLVLVNHPVGFIPNSKEQYQAPPKLLAEFWKVVSEPEQTISTLEAKLNVKKPKKKKKSTTYPMNGLRWTKDSNGHIPPLAVQGGYDQYDQILIVARAHHEDGELVGSHRKISTKNPKTATHGGRPDILMIPGYVSASRQCCFVGWNGESWKVDEYEVIYLNFKHILNSLNQLHNIRVLVGAPNIFWWVESFDGLPIKNAVVGGKNENGKTMFVGRTMHEGHLLPGKIINSQKCILVAYEGKEYSYNKYQVLVDQDPLKLVQESTTKILGNKNVPSKKGKKKH